jgi:hypothetical protein
MLLRIPHVRDCDLLEMEESSLLTERYRNIMEDSLTNSSFLVSPGELE